MKSDEPYIEPPDVFEIALKKTIIVPKIFFEIGSRDGLNAKAIAKKFSLKNENVYIVEAHPDCYIDIKSNFPYFKSFGRAIYDVEGEIYFNKIEEGNKGVSSLKDRNDNYYDDKAIKVKVRTQRADNFLKEQSLTDIDICKIDVEGCTYEILESFGKEIITVKVFHVECEHREIWQNQKKYIDVETFLIEKGYECIYFKYMSSHKWQSDSVWVLKEYILKNENK